MPLYRALEACYVDNVLHAPDDEFEFEFNGKVPDHVEEVEKPAAPPAPEHRRKSSS